MLFHSWCLSFPPQGGEKGHQETHAHLCQYMAQDWETLQEEHTIKAQMLVSQRSSMLAPNPTPLPLTRLFCTQALFM